MKKNYSEIDTTLPPIVLVYKRSATEHIDSPKKTIIGYMRSATQCNDQLTQQQNYLEKDMLRDGVDLSTVKWIRASMSHPHTTFLNHITADIKAVYVTDISRISRNAKYLRQVLSYFRENDIKLYTESGLVNFEYSFLFTNFIYQPAQGGVQL